MSAAVHSTIHSTIHRAGRVLIAVAWLVAFARAAASGPLPNVRFEGPAASARGDDVGAVAFDAERRLLAIGDAGGVLFGSPGAALRRVLRRGPVRDLAFLPGSVDPDRGLLAATERGLFRIDPDGSAAMLTAGTGELARQVVGIAVAPGAVAVATGVGAFVSPDGVRWKRLSARVPSGAATAVALRAVGGTLECWTAIGGRLWRVALRRDASGFFAGDASRITVPFAATGGGAVDVRTDLPGADVTIVYPQLLARRRSADDRWELQHPNLPPGASAVRLAFGVGSFWLGTDRGLLSARSPAGPWQRVAPPAGSAAVRALVGDAQVLYAATARGLFAGRVAAPVATAASRVPRTPEPSADPSIERVHLAALAYLSLQPHRLEQLRRGVARRGWLPVLSLRAGLQSDETRGTDFDESFLSGATRRLTDRDRDRSDELDLALTLSWDLGDTAFHPDSIDVSREARAVIELRDDVLDEITQFYFERRRVLVDLAALEDRTTPDAQRLRLRADELAAGIDAWTGGWFSRHAAPLAP